MKVESGLLLDVVVRESAAIFQLLASEDETLLVRGNSFLVLDLLLHLLHCHTCSLLWSFLSIKA
jgi:hypothetical protein